MFLKFLMDLRKCIFMCYKFAYLTDVYSYSIAFDQSGYCKNRKKHENRSFLILVTYISLPLNKLKTLYKFKSPLTQTSLCLLILSLNIHNQQYAVWYYLCLTILITFIQACCWSHLFIISSTLARLLFIFTCRANAQQIH